MSSEQRAERTLDEAIANKAMYWHSATPEETYTLNVAVAIARDEYKTAIERRVLAQQPCYGAWSNGVISDPNDFYTCEQMDALILDRPDDWPKGARCPSCTARQTQETSG